jgi:catechol 2,3-dioxygenase-like lactoylglutathione lyase family enzyme
VSRPRSFSRRAPHASPKIPANTRRRVRGRSRSKLSGAKNQDTPAKKTAAPLEAHSNRPPGANLNHVLVFVPDVEQAKQFYTEKFGFPEVFSFDRNGDRAGFTYLQISQNTFLELQPGSAEHPPGIGHIGLEVGNVEDAVKALRQHGLAARDPQTSRLTHARISGVEATPGVSFELLEFPPNSLVRKRSIPGNSCRIGSKAPGSLQLTQWGTRFPTSPLISCAISKSRALTVRSALALGCNYLRLAGGNAREAENWHR